MTQETVSFKKVAILTGLTMVIGGAEISSANATTETLPNQTFNFTPPGTTTGTDTVTFQQFNSSLGTLPGVQFGLDSTINQNASFGTITGAVMVNGVTLDTHSGAGTYDNSAINGLNGAANAAFYTGPSTFGVSLVLNYGGCESTCPTWDGMTSGETGVTITYNYTPSAVPLPAALPLFATGLGALGLLGWRRKRKAAAIAA